mmetsp:Transcript_6488/g.13038  ORF Transcript_6488/g.13038 Transcript_6488/m.13038 type:complete len:281 (+) Transcript_6488:257-1099(+)
MCPRSSSKDEPSQDKEPVVLSTTGRGANAQMRKALERAKLKYDLIDGEKYEQNPFWLSDMICFVAAAVPLMVYMGIRLYREVESPLEMVGPFVLSYFCIEPASGVLHIVLDNQKFNSWPILGEVAESFQKHHDHSSEISFRPTHSFFLEPMAPLSVILLQSLFITNTFTVATIFFLFFMAQLMMFSHRWSHMGPKTRPMFATFLQRTGVIMKPSHHLQHHKTYDCNFCICAGWANPFLNYLTRRHVDEENMVWIVPLLAFYLTPITVSFINGEVGHVGVF